MMQNKSWTKVDAWAVTQNQATIKLDIKLMSYSRNYLQYQRISELLTSHKTEDVY